MYFNILMFLCLIFDNFLGVNMKLKFFLLFPIIILNVKHCPGMDSGQEPSVISPTLTIGGATLYSSISSISSSSSSLSPNFTSTNTNVAASQATLTSAIATTSSSSSPISSTNSLSINSTKLSFPQDMCNFFSALAVAFQIYKKNNSLFSGAYSMYGNETFFATPYTIRKLVYSDEHNIGIRKQLESSSPETKNILKKIDKMGVTDLFEILAIANFELLILDVRLNHVHKKINSKTNLINRHKVGHIIVTSLYDSLIKENDDKFLFHLIEFLVCFGLIEEARDIIERKKINLQKFKNETRYTALRKVLYGLH